MSWARDAAKRVVQSSRTPGPVSRSAIQVRDAYRWQTRRWRVLPDFIIIGAHKGGTTSLYDYLSGHPQMVPAFEKEVHYFDRRYDGDPLSYQVSFPPRARMALTARRAGRAITGEASPYYLAHPHIPGRVMSMVPDAKIIALLRNPVDRAVSAFHHNRRITPHEPLETFAEAVERELEHLKGELELLVADEHHDDYEYSWHCYLTRGIYVRQLEWWQARVPAEQLLVLQSEALGSRPAEVFDEVRRFLGLSAWSPPEFERRNTNVYPAVPIDPELRAQLVEWYRPHNEALFALLGRRFDWD